MKKIILLLLFFAVKMNFCMQKEKLKKPNFPLLQVDSVMLEQEFDKDKYFGTVVVEAGDVRLHSKMSEVFFVTYVALVLGKFINTYEDIESISKLSLKFKSSQDTLPIRITSPIFFRSKKGRIYILHKSNSRSGTIRILPHRENLLFR